ncbi:MAG TPA: DUF3455 domain-containing protein [Candidatus Angelobacter sp.]|nr:DUF3455 domain-containing protein [Candidatus Angelobacter sp.]
MNTTIPAPIQVSPGSELIFIAHARGFQIYVCRAEGWVLKAPEALLYDQQGNVIGRHFAGPIWQHNDGSQISAKMAAKVDAPDPAAIPWLLLNVIGHSDEGVFNQIISIQRINTIGGLPPSTFCAESNRDSEFKSPYSADYYFYAATRS